MRPLTPLRLRSLRPPAHSARHSSHSSTDSASLNSDTCVLRLPDRSIAYSVFTPPNPTVTLFYLHGYPSSRLEAAGLAPLAAARGLQVVSPDRPGFGQTPFRPYSVGDTRDVLAVADALGVGRFSVLGASGGGPFALALAREERVDGVALLATAPPWDGPVNDSSGVRRAVAALARTPLFAPLAAAALAAGRYAVTSRPVQARIEAWLAAQNPDTPLSPEAAQNLRESVLRTLLEPFAGGVEGFAHETRLLTAPWGIRFEEIEREVRVWHARGDRAAPLSMVAPMVSRLPRGELTAFDGGHGDVGAVLPAVLDYFVPDCGNAAAH